MLNAFALITLAVLAFCIALLQGGRLAYTKPVPNSPITVPFFFPWVGSFFAFNRDPLKFFEQCHQRYGRAYKVLLAGRNIVVITHPDGISAINRDTNRNLTNENIFAHMLRGISGFSSNLHFIHELLDCKIFPITKLTLSPSSMRQVTERLDVSLRRHLLALAGEVPMAITLSHLIGRPLYVSGCYALFGPTFPFNTFSDFQTLDSSLPQLLTRLPFIAHQGLNARERILSDIEQYISAWWDSNEIEDIPQASNTVMESLKELKASKVDKREAARTLLLLLWGFHSNTWYMIFWLMMHLLIDQNDMRRLVQELDSAAADKALPDEEVKTSPLLESGILETLRWATTSTTVRIAEEDTELMVDGSTVRINKGEYVMGDVRAIHHDLSTFEHPDQFKLDRYLTPAESKYSVPQPMPWGGGKHMCVGRHVAVHVMRQFMFECLGLYNVEAAKSGREAQKLPRISSRHFIGSLKTREEVQVIITRRI